MRTVKVTWQTATASQMLTVPSDCFDSHVCKTSRWFIQCKTGSQTQDPDRGLSLVVTVCDVGLISWWWLWTCFSQGWSSSCVLVMQGVKITDSSLGLGLWLHGQVVEPFVHLVWGQWTVETHKINNILYIHSVQMIKTGAYWTHWKRDRGVDSSKKKVRLSSSAQLNTGTQI